MRLALLALLVAPLVAGAQSFPSRQITIVVPFSPGSTSDLIPRAIAPLVSQATGVPVIVDNRPGAGGNIGAAAVAKGEASGHTLLMAPSAILATNQWLYKELGFDPQKDLAPVINAASTPNLWVAHPSLPVKTMNDVIALAKAKPGSLSFASGGAGTTSHLCGELLKTTAQVDLIHVPYKGPAPAAQDLIAVTALKRHAQAPDVPSADESGLPGFEVNVWYGFAVQAATPKAAVQKLNSEIAKALRTPALAERLQGLGLEIVADTPEEFARFVAAESDKMRRLVRVSGARVD